MHIPYHRRGFLVRRASENASHLVVRSTGKRVAVASERPVYPRTEHRQVAAAAEPGEHFSRPPLCYRPRCSVDKPFTGTCGEGFHAMVLNRASTLPINSAMPRSPFILSRSALRLLTLYLFSKHNRARIAKKTIAQSDTRQTGTIILKILQILGL